MSNYYTPTGQVLVSRPAFSGLGQTDYASLLGKPPAATDAPKITGGSGAKSDGVDLKAGAKAFLDTLLAPFKPKPAPTPTTAPMPAYKPGMPSWVMPVAIGGVAIVAIAVLSKRRKS